MMESSPGEAGDRCAVVLTGELERGADDSRHGVVTGDVGGFVTAALDGVSSSSRVCSRSAVELVCTVHLDTSSDFTAGSSMSS